MAKQLIDNLLDDESIGSDNEQIPIRISAIIKSVNAKIETYLIAGGYSLPLPSNHVSLTEIAVELAIYGIHVHRNSEAPEGIGKRLKNAIDWLKEIRDAKLKGKDTLFPEQAVVVENSTIVLVNKSESDAEFSQSRLSQML